MAKQQRAAETQAAIIRGAATVFDARGYGDASLSEITKSAEVTKGALYFHYSSKEELALAVIDEQHRIATQSGVAVRASGYPALETIVRILRSFSDLLNNDVVVRAGIRLTFEASAFHADVTRPYKDWIREVQSLLRQAIFEGDVSEHIEPDELGNLLVGAYTGVQMVSNILSERQHLLAEADVMCKYLLPSIVHTDRRKLIPQLQALWA